MADNKKIRVGFIASGNGSILDYVAKAAQAGKIDAEIVALYTDRNCGVLDRAKDWPGCKAVNLDCPKDTSSADVSARISEQIGGDELDLICLAYNRLVTPPLLDRFKGRIVNIHMSLLPAFQGFGGVPKALAMGVPFGGASIHIVDETTDQGPLLIQSCVPLRPDMSEEEYTEKLYAHFCPNLCQVVQWYAEDRVSVKDGKAVIREAHYGEIPTNPALERDF